MRAQDVSIYYGQKKAIDEVSVDIYSEFVTAFIGLLCRQWYVVDRAVRPKPGVQFNPAYYLRDNWFALLGNALGATLLYFAAPAVMIALRWCIGKWTDNAEYPGLKSVVLYGDPNKPGPYAVRNRFAAGVMSRPHTHNSDRFVVVVSGTWWVGTGDKFDPASTKPLPAGSTAVHFAGKVHYDGAKDEACEVIIYGIGPVTSTRVGAK